jgi:hypothetical protein
MTKFSIGVRSENHGSPLLNVIIFLRLYPAPINSIRKNNYNSSQKHRVTLRERSSRSKNLILLVVEILRYAHINDDELDKGYYEIFEKKK